MSKMLSMPLVRSYYMRSSRFLTTESGLKRSFSGQSACKMGRYSMRVVGGRGSLSQVQNWRSCHQPPSGVKHTEPTDAPCCVINLPRRRLFEILILRWQFGTADSAKYRNDGVGNGLRHEMNVSLDSLPLESCAGIGQLCADLDCDKRQSTARLTIHARTGVRDGARSRSKTAISSETR